MRRKTAILCMMITALLLLGTMCGCKRQKTPEPVPPPSSTVQPPVSQEPEETAEETTGEEPEQPLPPALDYRADTRETLVEEGEKILLETHFSVPVVDGLVAVTAYYRDWLHDREYEAALEEETVRERYAEAQKNNSLFVPFAYESDFSVLRNDGVLFCVLRDFYENTGGVRPAYRLMAENFVAADGGMLILDDVFTVEAPVYRDRIRDAVLELLPEKIEEMGQDPYYEDVGDMMMEVFDNRNFCMTEDSLLVFWQTAAIAPAIAGVQQFEIPMESMADIIDPRWLP